VSIKHNSQLARGLCADPGEICRFTCRCQLPWKNTWRRVVRPSAPSSLLFSLRCVACYYSLWRCTITVPLRWCRRQLETRKYLPQVRSLFRQAHGGRHRGKMVWQDMVAFYEGMEVSCRLATAAVPSRNAPAMPSFEKIDLVAVNDGKPWRTLGGRTSLLNVSLRRKAYASSREHVPPNPEKAISFEHHRRMIAYLPPRNHPLVYETTAPPSPLVFFPYPKPRLLLPPAWPAVSCSSRR